MHHLPTSLVSNERANCIVYRSLFPVDFHLWSWYHCFLLHRRLRGGWLLYRVSASPGSLESHSIVGQTLRQLKPQLCLECWPAGLHCFCFLDSVNWPMGNGQPLKGTLSCCQSEEARLEIQFGRETDILFLHRTRNFRSQTSEPIQ